MSEKAGFFLQVGLLVVVGYFVCVVCMLYGSEICYDFLSKFFGRECVYSVVGCSVILVVCAQILEVKCSNQPSGCGILRGMSQVQSCEYRVNSVVICT